MSNWHKLDKNVWYRNLIDGYEFIQIVLLDTCPHDSSKEYCVCRAQIETMFGLDSAYDDFQENCLYDFWCVKEECSYEEALDYVREQTKN